MVFVLAWFLIIACVQMPATQLHSQIMAAQSGMYVCTYMYVLISYFLCDAITIHQLGTIPCINYSLPHYQIYQVLLLLPTNNDCCSTQPIGKMLENRGYMGIERFLLGISSDSYQGYRANLRENGNNFIADWNTAAIYRDTCIPHNIIIITMQATCTQPQLPSLSVCCGSWQLHSRCYSSVGNLDIWVVLVIMHGTHMKSQDFLLFTTLYYYVVCGQD